MAELTLSVWLPKRRCQIKRCGTILLKDFLQAFISMVIKYNRLEMNANGICAKDIENSSTLNGPVTPTLRGIIRSYQPELKVLDFVYHVKQFILCGIHGG